MSKTTTKKFDDFSQEERTIIAEFVFGKANNVLIKSDGTDLINVLERHGLVDNAEELKNNVLEGVPGMSSLLGNVLHYGIVPDDGKRIMNEYYGNE